VSDYVRSAQHLKDLHDSNRHTYRPRLTHGTERSRRASPGSIGPPSGRCVSLIPIKPCQVGAAGGWEAPRIKPNSLGANQIKVNQPDSRSIEIEGGALTSGKPKAAEGASFPGEPGPCKRSDQRRFSQMRRLLGSSLVQSAVLTPSTVLPSLSSEGCGVWLRWRG